MRRFSLLRSRAVVIPIFNRFTRTAVAVLPIRLPTSSSDNVPTKASCSSSSPCQSSGSATFAPAPGKLPPLFHLVRWQQDALRAAGSVLAELLVRALRPFWLPHADPQYLLPGPDRMDTEPGLEGGGRFGAGGPKKFECDDQSRTASMVDLWRVYECCSAWDLLTWGIRVCCDIIPVVETRPFQQVLPRTAPTAPASAFFSPPRYTGNRQESDLPQSPKTWPRATAYS